MASRHGHAIDVPLQRVKISRIPSDHSRPRWAIRAAFTLQGAVANRPTIAASSSRTRAAGEMDYHVAKQATHNAPCTQLAGWPACHCPWSGSGENDLYAELLPLLPCPCRQCWQK